MERELLAPEKSANFLGVRRRGRPLAVYFLVAVAVLALLGTRIFWSYGFDFSAPYDATGIADHPGPRPEDLEDHGHWLYDDDDDTWESVHYHAENGHGEHRHGEHRHGGHRHGEHHSGQHSQGHNLEDSENTSGDENRVPCHKDRHGDGKHHDNSTLNQLRTEVSRLVSKTHLKKSLEHYFLVGPHLAGQNLELVNYTEHAFAESGYDTKVDEYDIWLNYPVSHRVALLKSNGSVKYELSLEEPVLAADPTTAREDRIPTFHGYSASGNATGELIYANFGRRRDYDRLIEEGISFEGKVVLVRYGGIFRGLKVKFAEELGASAVLIYSDPAEDGGITEEEGFAAYPEGPARHPESVQRGSVQDLSHSPGDPTTPGWPSLPGDKTDRKEPQGIPGIPSVPISYADALPLLKALNNHGPLYDDWKGALKGVTYNAGPSALQVTVESQQDYDFRRNYDVIARVQGESNSEVIIGNHRDAWIIGGADPNSGTAVILEVARVFGKLLESGWKPKRTIVFASWDGEEYGLLGSTEWGEDHADHLQKSAVAYINCDVGVSGTDFSASANPLLHKVIQRTAERVLINDQDSLSAVWRNTSEARIEPLGSGSDYTVFQDHLGIPSLDVGFSGGKGSPVYHYHSNYDSLHWMQEFGDPELIYHEAITRFVALAALELIESDIIPFGIEDYARSLRRDVKNLLHDHVGPADEEVRELFHQLHRFIHEARYFERYARHIRRELRRTRKRSGFWNFLKRLKLLAQSARINDKLRKLDQFFLHAEGLDDRPWFKHVIYAPGRYTGYAGQVLPGIAESLEDGDERRLIRWVGIVTEAISAATDSLR